MDVLHVSAAQYGCNYTAEHSLLSPSGRMSGRARKAALNRERDLCAASLSRLGEYAAKVRTGEIIDPTGRYSRRSMIEHEIEQVRSGIGGNENLIRFYSGVGIGKRGTLKPTYVLIVARYQKEIDDALATIARLTAEAESLP